VEAETARHSKSGKQLTVQLIFGTMPEDPRAQASALDA
jgi:hypothetical protein